MKVVDLRTPCKTQVFKNLIRDMIFSIRQSTWKLANVNIDIKLSKIRLTPITLTDSKQFNAKVSNLVGGGISFLIDQKIIDFLKEKIEFDNSSKIFITDILDIFSHSQNNLLKLDYSNNETAWDNNLYYVKLNIIIKMNSNVIDTSIIIAVDELTSLYFVS